VTGGSWDLSQQLSISLKGGIAKDAIDMEEKGAGADVWVPPKVSPPNLQPDILYWLVPQTFNPTSFTG